LIDKKSLKFQAALAAQQSTRERDYWLNTLADLPDKVSFPFDRKKGVNKRRIDTVNRIFPEEISISFSRISKGVDHALHMVLTAALLVLLHKYTGSDDIVVGMPIYKQSVEAEFVNTAVALRNKIPVGMTFKELLLQVRQHINEAVEHQNYPIEILSEQLNRSMDGEGNDFPLFDVVIILQNIHDKTYIEDISTNMVWCFNLNRMDNRLEAAVEYNALFYKEDTINRIIDHWMFLVQQVLANNDLPISEVSLMTGSDKKQLLAALDKTAVRYPREKTIHQLFEEQAEKSGDGVAVIGQGAGARHAVPLSMDHVSITYKELNKKSNQLAHLLRKKGVGYDTIVGICMEPSIELIIGILGILKAGGGYLPIDPEYPEERKQYMLADSGTGVLVSELSEVSKVSEGTEFVTHLTHLTHPTQLCYVIYTSGSTGKPKGAAVQHRNVVRLFFNDAPLFDFSSRDTWTLFHSVGFDFSVWEMWGALLFGGQLVVLPRAVVRDTNGYLDILKKQQVTILNQTPSAFYVLMMAESQKQEKGLNLRYIIFGGEALNPGKLKPWQEKYPQVKLVNMYGITETTVHVTYKEITEREIESETSNIGIPIPGLGVCVVDKNFKPVPLGVAGELCVYGEGLCRGYLNRPELTAEKFFDYRSYMSYRTYRSYKTGDLGRVLENGDLEYLGRIDQQVKIRGFRIELGEIESQLLKHPDIKDVVVIDREMESGEKYLCAYIIPGHRAGAPGEVFSREALREFLSHSLPDYMIPAYFVTIDRIPLTPNKKVDRKALPEPEKTAADTYAPPQTRLEEELVDIWSHVLGIEPQNIGIDDDFFSLGGHSLKAVILISRINKVLGMNVLLAEMFTYSTIRQLAKRIQGSAKAAHWDIKPVEEKEYYPLSPSQKRLYILQQMDKNNMSYNMPGVFILEGDLEKEKFEEVFNRLIKRHESLRTSFQVADEEPVQRVRDTVNFEIEYSDLATGRGGSLCPPFDHDKGSHGELPLQYTEIIGDFVRPFDLSQSPLLRLGLIKSAPREHILMFDMHHIITDGTSQGIFTREFLQLYASRELPLLNLQYKDYSLWQRSEVQIEALKKQEAYWLDRFKGEVPVLVLPYDFPRPPVTRFEGSRVGFLLEGAETTALRRAARQQGTSLYMVLLAVFNVLLWKLSGQEDIIIGTPIAARRHADLEPIIGMFVNTLVMRHFPAGKKTFKAFLQEVKANTLEAFENQEYPFEELVEKVNVPRDAGRNPLFDVMFALQNWERTGGEITGLIVKPYPFENRTSKFDLNLDAVEMAEHITFSLEYSTALFKESAIRKFIGYFKKIVTHITTPGGMETKLTRIGILEAEEKQQLLEMANGPDEPLDMQKTIQGLFAEQAARTPDSVSIVGSWQLAVGKAHGALRSAITYSELNKKSNQLAHLLRKKGVGSDTIVGICMEPSIELIIGILGILKAGGGYLPIDPEYPEERKQYMLADSGTGVLVSELSEVSKVSEGTEFVTHLTHLTHPTQLCYVIYTSGSTGTPKGVMLEHYNLVNLLLYQYRHTTIDFSRVLQFTTISFDVSFQEIFSTLLAGGTLFLVNKEIKQDIPGLFELVDKNKIGTLFLPASFLKFVLSNEEYVQRIPRGVKHIVTAGEQLVVTPVFKEYIISQNIRLHNHYGPSETHVVTALTLDPGSGEDIPELPSIGRPIANTVIDIVDRECQLQPHGVAGELLIAGASVGRGYLNQPELSAEMFLSASYRSYRSYRTYKSYKTGDLARWLPDGNIQFLGRMDHQVKIRGFRVELGEIENSLMALAGIKEAVVTARRDEKGENYLCAYVVPENESDVNVSVLRQQLSARLPDFMLPSYFMKLNQIPLTPSKKVDRRALPAPEPSRPQLETAYLAPITRMEKLIADTWKDILKLDKIGTNDNFFHLGGNSLSLIKSNNKLKEILKKEIPVMMMFQFPTIRSLAQYLKEEETQDKTAAVEQKAHLEERLDKGKARLKATRKKIK
jgi:amino acid adenylation domain-containing protein